MGPLLTLFSTPLPTPLLTRPLKNYFYRHFGVSEISVHYEGPVNGNSGIEIFDRGLQISSWD